MKTSNVITMYNKLTSI